MNSRYSRHGRFPNDSWDERNGYAESRPRARDDGYDNPDYAASRGGAAEYAGLSDADADYRPGADSDRWREPWAYRPKGGYVGYSPYLAPIPGRMDAPARRRDIPRWEGRGYDYGSARESDRGFFTRAADEVASWFGDEDAERRRERDYRGYGPRGYTRSDDRIHEDVNDRLMDEPEVDATDITVSVANREVTLDGTVDSRLAKRRAEDCADAVSGVTYVQNNLRIRSAAETPQGAS